MRFKYELQVFCAERQLASRRRTGGGPTSGPGSSTATAASGFNSPRAKRSSSTAWLRVWRRGSRAQPRLRLRLSGRCDRQAPSRVWHRLAHPCQLDGRRLARVDQRGRGTSRSGGGLSRVRERKCLHGPSSLFWPWSWRRALSRPLCSRPKRAAVEACLQG